MATPIPKLLDCFAQLIELPSISSNDPWFDQSNRKVVDLLAGWLEKLGFAVEIMPVSATEDKVNLIAKAGQGEGGLVLSGHTDTVPIDEHVWSYDPFKLTEHDGRLYGLGSSDMKCFFPIIMEAAQRFNTRQFKQPLYILATADEESNMSGAKALLASGRKLGRYALIGEPTGMKPVFKHKGILAESIELIGQAGHSSDPALGNSALEGMNHVINALQEWRADLQSRYQDQSFKVPVPTLNFGAIRGGDNPNRICAECELKIDLRLLPDMRADDLREQLHEHVSRSIAGSGLEVKFEPLFEGMEAMQTSRNSEILSMAEKLTGSKAQTVAFGTEGPYLNAMGMQTVILGPGNIDVAHQADEYLEMENIVPMTHILEQLINHFCNKEQ